MRSNAEPAGEARSPFGECLREFRVAANLSQETLAERAGVSVSGIRALERGTRRAPHRDTVALLASALELTSANRSRLQDAAVRISTPRQRGVRVAGDGRAAEHHLPLSLTSFHGRTVRTGASESNSAWVAQLANKQLLIVLDNCEHLLDAAATVTQQILERCPDVRVLATSREALRIGGEYALRVDPLAVPITAAERPATLADVRASPAATLFLDRARHVVSGYTFEGLALIGFALAEFDPATSSVRGGTPLMPPITIDRVDCTVPTFAGRCASLRCARVWRTTTTPRLRMRAKGSPNPAEFGCSNSWT